jgi:hypothetical protein
MSPRSASERLARPISPVSASLDANHSQADSLVFAREQRSRTSTQALPVKKIGPVKISFALARCHRTNTVHCIVRAAETRCTDINRATRNACATLLSEIREKTAS